MVKLSLVYEGEHETVITHEPSGQILHTVSPADLKGKAHTFSPTDLVAAALASCIATVLGIYAEKKGLDLRGMKIEAEKEMRDNPRRIGKIAMTIWIPIVLTAEEQEKFKKIAMSCPVFHSLHPDVEHSLTFHWKL